MVQQVRVVPGRGGGHRIRQPGPVVGCENGIALRPKCACTDEAGHRFLLSGSIEPVLAAAADGTGPVTVQLSLTATPTESTTGPPARIEWHASRLAPVEVPFELANVPVVK